MTTRPTLTLDQLIGRFTTAKRIEPNRTVYEGFILNGTRYTFDNALDYTIGWRQFDTSEDAWHYGVWTNCPLRATVSYAEGDVRIVVYANEEEYAAGIKRMKAFYEKIA